jgi:hypothetical protein
MQPSAVSPRTEIADARESRMAGHIREASDVTGVPFEYLLAQANQESRLDPDARSRRSSAMGLYQFTVGTWLDMVKKYGGNHDLQKYADAITQGSDGRWKVEDKALRKEILDLRRDPKTSALMAGEYAKENERWLENKLGRQVSAHDLYLAHFLGAGGALRVIRGMQESPREEAAVHLPEAADANPEVFNERQTGQARSLASLYSTVRARFQHSMADVGVVARRVRPPVDLAELRPPARPGSDADASVVAPAPVQVAQSPIADASVTISDLPHSVLRSEIPKTATVLASDPTTLGLTPRQETAVTLASDSQFPVRLPPPLRAPMTDGPMLRILLDDQGKKA